MLTGAGRRKLRTRVGRAPRRLRVIEEPDREAAKAAKKKAKK